MIAVHRLFVALCLSAAVGCFDSRKDLVGEHRVTIQALASDSVIISGPDVIASNENLTISGIVTRKTGHDEPISGHVDISVLDSAGSEIDYVAVSLIPRSIPSSGERRSTFSIEAVGLPPVGSIIQVAFVDDLHPSTRPGEGLAAGGGAGHSGSAHGGAPHAQSHGFHFSSHGARH